MTDAEKDIVDRLKPCPFCGSDRITVFNIRDGQQAACKDCKSGGSPTYHGPNGPAATWGEAVKAWNARAAKPTLRAEVERLTALGSDYEEVLADKRRLTRELDVAMHGEDGAAKQASMCDLIEPAKNLRTRAEKAEAALGKMRGDCKILLANLDWLTECFGEGVEGEDAVLVSQIRASLTEGE